MRTWFVLVAILASVAVTAAGCGGLSTLPSASDAPTGGEDSSALPPGAATGEEVNFRLLISDEPNDIGDFTELNVTIIRIGVQGGESGGWTEHEIVPAESVDLTELQGTNATEIWSGQLEDGTYSKIFIYVDSVEGVLVNGDGGASVRLPGGKLQISKPFEVSSGEITDFVFDITVIKTGGSDRYILKPQIAQSGSGQDVTEVDSRGKPDDKGKPDDVGKPDDAGAPSDAGSSTGEEFHGTIQGIVGTTWTVLIDGEPEPRTVDVSQAEIEGDPVQDSEVDITGTVDEDGTIIASEVEFAETEDVSSSDEEFHGIIESADGTVWTVLIDGESRAVDVNDAEIEGDPVQGSEVDITGTVDEDGTIIASEVEEVEIEP